MRFLWIALLMLAAVPLAGCEAVESIFQAGIWVGAFMVVLVIAIVGYIAFRIRG